MANVAPQNSHSGIQMPNQNQRNKFGDKKQNMNSKFEPHHGQNFSNNIENTKKTTSSEKTVGKVGEGQDWKSNLNRPPTDNRKKTSVIVYTYNLLVSFYHAVF